MPGSDDSPACGACSSLAQPGQRFCGQCGAPLSQICAACGQQNPPHHRFCGNCGTPLTTAPAPPSAAEVSTIASVPREERRWATLLFADLSGFTAMSERMDPEDVKALADRCAEHLGEQVQQFGGTVIHVAGDEVAAVFGAPLAHEDDAERAVRAALAMRDSPLGENEAQPIQVHIGLNTGEVAAGLVGPRSRREYTVMGDPVNTAARLASAAPPGSVWVGEETYRATHRVVRYHSLPPVAAKGKEKPVPVWEALDVAPVPEARPLGTAPLVGRDEELALLAGIWTRVLQEKQPHLVTVLGEPGIGKSRLVAEFEEHALSEARVLHGRCLPYGEALGYWALTTVMKEAAGITSEDDSATARAKLELLVSNSIEPQTAGEASTIARHLALITGLDVAADRGTAVADHRALHASVRRFLEAFGRRQPLCLVFEDIHWADSALLDLIEYVAARAQDASLLVITQARPELLEQRSTWGGGVRALTSLSLEPLGPHARRSLALALCREHNLAVDVVDQIGSGSGGNPLFAEEMVATLAAQGGQGAGEASGGIPTLIKALISARLDLLPPEERSTIQLAAVLGKVFWRGGVEALGAPGNVNEQLDAMVTKGLLRAQSGSQFRGEQEYTFKHDLICDVAYDTLPRAERRTLHGRAVDWIERAGGQPSEENLDLLAHHAVQAEQHERALDYLTRAAERASRAAAHREAAALLARAITLAERLDQERRVAELRARRGTAFCRVGLRAEARVELEVALAGLAPESSEPRIRALIELANSCHWLFDDPATRRYATEALASAEEAGRDDLAGAAMGCVALADCSDGELEISLTRYQRAFARAGAGPAAQLAPAMEMCAMVLYWLGRAEEAAELCQEAIRVGRAANDIISTSRAYGDLGLAQMARGRYQEALQAFQEARRLAQEYGVTGGDARTAGMCAGLHLELFDFQGAEALSEEAREIGRRAAHTRQPVVSGGIDLLLNFARRQEVGRAERLVDEVAEAARTAAGVHGWLWKLRLAQARAEIALARGDWEDARHWAEDAIGQSRLRHRVKYEVLGLGTRAQALAARGRTHEAIADLRSALELARPVGDPVMFLRAATALLVIDGDDALATEARTAAERIAEALPEGELRQRFLATEPVRRLVGPDG
jgi:class 3 adenylate cyclase/tetratricopeptide (TPR) repeat protein